MKMASELCFTASTSRDEFRSLLRVGRFHRKTTESPRLAGAVCLTLMQVMKRAFVIRFSPETNPTEGTFQGHVEEVDTGRELRFRSLDEFLAFLQKCLANRSVDQ